MQDSHQEQPTSPNKCISASTPLTFKDYCCPNLNMFQPPAASRLLLTSDTLKITESKCAALLQAEICREATEIPPKTQFAFATLRMPNVRGRNSHPHVQNNLWDMKCFRPDKCSNHVRR